MRAAALALLLALLAPAAAAGDFWLRGPYDCGGTNGDGTAYSCAASPGAVGAKIVNRAVNVNTGLWGNTGTTVGAGDRLFVCGVFDLPLVGADLRDFLKITGVTFDANNPLVVDFSCPAGIANGPSVADPTRADLKEDWRSRTWTDRGSNIWSTPIDGANIFPNYVACNDPDALGVEVDTNNSTGLGARMPTAFCEFNSRGNASTELWVYSVGNPASYYTALWASAKNFFQASNASGLTILGDANVSNTNTSDNAVTWGAGYFQHMNYGVYLGTFSSATTYPTNIIVRGLPCKNMTTCVQHDGQAGSTYYPRFMLWERNACQNMGKPCLWVSGKIGAPFEMRYNWGKNLTQSNSSGAFYFAANLDRATHPLETPILIHHNFVNGVGYGRYWLFDGHGIYIEEGTKGVTAFSNVVMNLTAPGQVGFISNSAYPGNSHLSSVCINCAGLARASDSASNGNNTTVFENLTGTGITGTALVISGNAGEAPTFRNINAVAAPSVTTSFVATQSVTTITPTFQSVNAFGFKASPDYYNGSVSIALPNRTQNDPQLAGGVAPSTLEGACPLTSSPLNGAGTYTGAWITGAIGDSLGNPPTIGGLGTCKRRAIARTRVAARTRALN